MADDLENRIARLESAAPDDRRVDIFVVENDVVEDPDQPGRLISVPGKQRPDDEYEVTCESAVHRVFELKKK